VHGVVTALGCDQQNMEKNLSDFKWAGHRLAHMLADGWPTGSYKRKITFLETPTGTLHFYYKDIKQEIVHTWLLEEYGVSKKCVIIMDRRQDSTWLRLQQEKVDLLLRIVTVPEVLEDVRRNSVQTKKNRNKSGIYDNYITCLDIRCSWSIGLELKLC